MSVKIAGLMTMKIDGNGPPRGRNGPPDITRMGPEPTGRHCPTVILEWPLHPVGNNPACQPKSLSSVSGAANPAVASSIMATHSVDPTVNHWNSAMRYAKAAGQRRAHLGRVKDLALDFAGLHHLINQRLQSRDLQCGKPQIGQASQEPSLPVTTLGQ